MHESFFFYDLETSGLNPRTDRIMQFAGIRTDLDFQTIGEPINLLVQLSDDTLPSPDAIMVTGITPHQTRTDGITEREFARFFTEEVATPGTTIIGYNSVRFDDEFIRNALWRNFYEPYTWQWQDGRSRWDVLDVVRLTRALRPDGINWPVTPEGKPTNRLELITKENHITHEHAHDALSDVEALIAVTKLIKEKQPQLFDFLYNLRTKRAVQNLILPSAQNSGAQTFADPRPFVYCSGRYSSEFLHTTVAVPIAPADNGNLLVYDLRYNLDDLLAAESAALEKGYQIADGFKKSPREREPWEANFFPTVKKLQYNHCPAVAPLGVLDKSDGWQKIGLTKDQIQQNLKSLQRHPEFIQRMAELPRPDYPKAIDVESRLYDGFISPRDQTLCATIRNNDANHLADYHPPFQDDRLPELLLHYKAKNFPDSLDAHEQEKWEKYRRQRLERQSSAFLAALKRIQEHLADDHPYGNRSVEDCAFLVEELMLWYESLGE